MAWMWLVASVAVVSALVLLGLGRASAIVAVMVAGAVVACASGGGFGGEDGW